MITQSMLRRHFDARAFEQGERYHRQGQVSALRSEAGAGGAVRVTARVRGSQPSPYRQDIRLFLRDGAPISISGVCECPVGLNCKHVAAAVLAWAGASATAAPPSPDAPEMSTAVRQILSRMEEAAALDSGDAYPDTVRTRLLYVLRVDEKPGGREAVVRFLSVSLRKDGQFGAQEKPYNPGNIHGASVAKFVTPADRTILSAVLEQRGYGLSSWHGTPLRAERAAWLIERMVRTGRLYWEDFRANPPLRPGPVRVGRARWTADTDGRQRFTFDLDAESVCLLPTVPPVYLDLDRWECGTVAAEVPAHLAAALLAAPPLAPADVPAFRDGAVRFAALLPVLPDPPAGAETRRVTPRPVLRLLLGRRPPPSPYGWYPVGDAFDPNVPAAELGFDYAGRRVALDAPSAPFQWMEDGILVTVPRDGKAEAKAATRLRGAGLSVADPPLTVAGEPSGQRRLFTVAGDPFDVAAGWLRFCDTVVPALRAEGWAVEIDRHFPYQVVEATGDWAFDLGDGTGIDWFGVTLGVEVGGERIDLLPVLRSVIAVLDTLDPDASDPGDDLWDGGEDEAGAPGIDAALEVLAPEGTLYVPVGDTRFLPLAVDRVRPLIHVLMELFGLLPDGEGLRIGRAHLGDLAALEDAASAAGIPVLGADAVRRMARALREAGGIPAVPAPAGLRATLRPYQQAGLAWLQVLAAHGFGGFWPTTWGWARRCRRWHTCWSRRRPGGSTAPACWWRRPACSATGGRRWSVSLRACGPWSCTARNARPNTRRSGTMIWW